MPSSPPLFTLFLSSLRLFRGEGSPLASLSARPGNLCQVLPLSLSLALLLTLFLSKKVHIPLSISLYPFAPSPWFLPYGQMLPYNDLFLHLIPDLSSTFSLLFLRPAFSRLSRNTTRRVPPRERETIPRGASRVALGTLVPEEVRIGLEDRGRDRGKDGG